MMSEKRFIRNMVGDIYDSEKDKWFEEDWKGKSLGYDDDLIVFLNEQQATINKLKEENERLKEKLNVTALELVDEAISMGKAVEISEMDYHEFLGYRKRKGKAMELQR